MPITPNTIFAPDPATRARFLDDCASPDLSLRELAQHYHTTVEAVAAYIATRDVSEALAQLETAALRRIRLTALANLPRAVDALLWTLINAAAESANELPPTTPRAESLRERKRENIRRATNLLFRLTRLNPTPTPPPDAPLDAPLDAGPEESSTKVRVELARGAPREPERPVPIPLAESVASQLPAPALTSPAAASSTPAPRCRPTPDSPAASDANSNPGTKVQRGQWPSETPTSAQPPPHP